MLVIFDILGMIWTAAPAYLYTISIDTGVHGLQNMLNMGFESGTKACEIIALVACKILPVTLLLL